MIVFSRMGLLERIKRLWPAYRLRRETEMREAIRELVSNPGQSCMVDSYVIKDGYGMVGTNPLVRDVLGKPPLW